MFAHASREAVCSLALTVLCAAGMVSAQDPFSVLARPAFDAGVQTPTTPAAGDVDADGDVDLVLASVLGPDRLFLNDGEGVFRDVSATHMPPDARWTSAATLVDVDGDGDLDLALAINSGMNSIGGQNRLLLNDGTGRFTDVTSSHLPPDLDKTVVMAAVDVDGDGDADLLCLNADQALPSNGTNRLYVNDGTGRFTDVTATHLPLDPGNGGQVRIGDLDGDGDPDFVIGLALPDANRPLRVYLNDGSGRYTALPTGRLPSLATNAQGIQLEDIDGDGDLDVVALVGQRIVALVNDGAARFTDQSTVRMPTGYGVPGVALDFDGDGDVDFTTLRVGPPQMLVNDGTGVFAFGPTIPEVSELAVDVDTDGDLDLVCVFLPDVFLNDGLGRFHDRRIAQRRGPDFAGRPERAASADIDGDGDLDVWITGDMSDRGRLLRNDGRGGFVEVTPALPSTRKGTRSIALGDVDADGDVDAITSDWHFPGGSRLLLGDGVGGFVDVTAAQLPGTSEQTLDLEFVDVDADGDLDLVRCNFWFPSDLLLNDGRGVFTAAGSGTLPNTSHSSRGMAAVDIDGDGDVDLVFANDEQPARLLRNDGTGVFQDVSVTHLPGLSMTAFDVDAIDVESDGDADLVFVGFTNGPWLFLNDGTGRFTDGTAGRLPATLNGTQVHVLDRDGDGDLDLVAGGPGSVRSFDNDGQGHFSLLQQWNTAGQVVAGVDLDQDTDPDLLLVPENGPIAVASNLRRHVHFERLVRVGRNLQIDAYAVGRGPGTAIATHLLALGDGRLPIPGLGVFGLDPQSTAVAGVTVLASGQASTTLNLGVPASPALIGGVLFAQALIFEGASAQFTNAERIEIIH